MYIAAEELHSSGVLAVVCGGLFTSFRRHKYLNSKSRLRGENVWASLVFVLNGLVFLIIGLSLPTITRGLEGVTLSAAIGYGLLITAVLIVGRIISAYGAVFVTLIARNFIKVADARHPGYRTPFILGWTGMRGVVSLAAALSIPVHLSNGNPFPQRNLILFITFIVILLTLVIQGLTLPYLIRKIGLPDMNPIMSDDDIELKIRKGLTAHALQQLKENYAEQIEKEPYLQQLVTKWEQHQQLEKEEILGTDAKMIYLEILNRQRQWLLNKNQMVQGLDEDVVRRHLQQLDLEEERVRYTI
jgi:NhaP-type Na+/H+ or K+/H+ antiporter